MIVTKTIKNIVQYITEGFVEIFSPSEDSYPAVGLQPYAGTIASRKSRHNW